MLWVFTVECRSSALLLKRIWGAQRRSEESSQAPSCLFSLFPGYMVTSGGIYLSLVLVYFSRPRLLIRIVSVSCVKWCLAPTWSQNHTMKAKSMRKISVKKVLSRQASGHFVIERCYEFWYYLLNSKFCWQNISLASLNFRRQDK